MATKARTISWLGAIILNISFQAFFAYPAFSQGTAVTNGGKPVDGTATAPLTIADKNRVVAPKESSLILLLDYFPNKNVIDTAGTEAANVMMATAKFYANEYLSKAEFSKIDQITVFLVYVSNMDEYNRANYSGMKRFGTLTYKRSGNEVELTENKFSFP